MTIQEQLAAAERVAAQANHKLQLLQEAVEQERNAEIASELGKLGFTLNTDLDNPNRASLIAHHPVLGQVDANDPEKLLQRAKSKVEADARLKEPANRAVPMKRGVVAAE